MAVQIRPHHIVQPRPEIQCGAFSAPAAAVFRSLQARHRRQIPFRQAQNAATVYSSGARDNRYPPWAPRSLYKKPALSASRRSARDISQKSPAGLPRPAETHSPTGHAPRCPPSAAARSALWSKSSSVFLHPPAASGGFASFPALYNAARPLATRRTPAGIDFFLGLLYNGSRFWSALYWTDRPIQKGAWYHGLRKGSPASAL